MRCEEYIYRIRKNLSIEDTNRFSDTTLIFYISQAIEAINATLSTIPSNSRILLGEYEFDTVAGQTDYDLPSDIYSDKVLAVFTGGTKLSLKSVIEGEIISGGYEVIGRKIRVGNCGGSTVKVKYIKKLKRVSKSIGTGASIAMGVLKINSVVPAWISDEFGANGDFTNATNTVCINGIDYKVGYTTYSGGTYNISPYGDNVWPNEVIGKPIYLFGNSQNEFELGSEFDDFIIYGTSRIIKAMMDAGDLNIGGIFEEGEKRKIIDCLMQHEDVQEIGIVDTERSWSR